MSSYIKQIPSWWLKITIMKMDKEMSLYNTELIKNIQKSSHANVNEDDRLFEFNLTDLVYHRWEYSQMNLFRHVLAHVKITLSFHLFLALLCSSSDTNIWKKKTCNTKQIWRRKVSFPRAERNHNILETDSLRRLAWLERGVCMCVWAGLGCRWVSVKNNSNAFIATKLQLYLSAGYSLA